LEAIMAKRTLMLLGALGILALAGLGCRSEFEATFDHKYENPPADPAAMAGHAVYEKYRWVKFSSLEQYPKKGWLVHRWFVYKPSGEEIDPQDKDDVKEAGIQVHFRKDAETGARMGDRMWVKFPDTGKWEVKLYLRLQRALRCRDRKCRKPIRNLPFLGDQKIQCQGCGGIIEIPKLSIGGPFATK